MSSCGEREAVEHPCREQAMRIFSRRPGARDAQLASVIYDDIVPRLQMLHHAVPARDAERAVTGKEIAEFGRILVLDDGVAADLFLRTLRDRDFSEETLVLGLLTETARHLGGLWDDDRLSFVDVTIGVARLQKILCIFSGASEAVVSSSRQRAALCAMTGETHIFGLDMVACFMRRAHWDVDLHKNVETADVVDLVRHDWFAVMGFTLSSEPGLDALCRAIQSGRAASLNPEIGILVGGPLFRQKPGLVAQVGADAMAEDAASATLLAKKLLLRQKTRSANDRFAPARIREWSYA